MYDSRDSDTGWNHRMTIVLADAHFRDRLKKRLEKIAGVHVVGGSSDSEEPTAMTLNRKPDIAILNSSLRDGRAIKPSDTSSN